MLFSVALFVVSAATDEGGVALATRAARMVPLLAVPAACAYVVTLYRAIRRGETRALEAVGVEPLSWQIRVAMAALVPALVGALALALGLDASGLFPAATAAKPCTLAGVEAGHAIFLCAQAGLRVHGASIELLAPLGLSVGTSPRGLAAAAAVVLTAVPVVLWAGAALTRPAYGLAALGLLLGETTMCQLVGANVAPAAAAVVVPALAVAAMLAVHGRQKAMARVPSTRAMTQT